MAQRDELCLQLSTAHLSRLRETVDPSAQPDGARLTALLKDGVADVATLKLLRKLRHMHGLWVNDLLADGRLSIPEPPAAPPRNAQLEARVQRLKAEQAERDYRRMTANVDGARGYGRTPLLSAREAGAQSGGLGAEMRGLNRQLTVVLNTLLTVGGAFFFGFKGVDLAAPGVFDFAVRMALGMVLATAVFFADLYFIVKNDMYLGQDQEGDGKSATT